ncbi:hypothetical protein M404DRAFT_584693 [Pisolithus tinctorius Marx 270]|uniref:Uncharacterized protein n=1 Tax=Pisolithus tinctorius Marx 270 TaxID=870435 RepID=A0A0C3PX85_PISTI|nr:hypothetical protein M404DRAFT_584693 [Pisolithus tinctorius Marx 270]
MPLILHPSIKAGIWQASHALYFLSCISFSCPSLLVFKSIRPVLGHLIIRFQPCLLHSFK